MNLYNSTHDFMSSRGRSSAPIINIKMVMRVMGILLAFEGGLLLISMLVSLAYGEAEYVSFLYTIGIVACVAMVLLLCGRNAGRTISKRDSFIVVGLSWLMFTLFGMLPYLFSGSIPGVADAFFETMSGFTTTGATILDNIESLGHGMLFWRSLTQWVGGLGIIFFTVALLPVFGGNGQILFLTEATGVTHEKLHPKVQVMARYIGAVYVLLSAVECVLLLIGGMSLFDAVCHSFATTATGGFSTKQDSISYWNSPFIEYVVTLFMILSGINFSLYFMAIKGGVRDFFRDGEMRWFLSSLGIMTVIIAVTLIFKNDYGVEMAFRKALFQVATCHTSCGFASDDFCAWPPFVWMILIFAMLSGGSTGSTSGGIKCMRIMILASSVRNRIRQLLHPREVLPVRVGDKMVAESTVNAVLVFFVSYMLCVFVGWILLMFFGVGFSESMSTVISAMGNVGPGLGCFGPAYSWAALPEAGKWILSAFMLIGRLEIFALMMIFYTGFWKND